MVPRRLALLGLSALFCLALASVSAAEVYKWVDSDGVIHFSDSQADLPTKGEVEVEVFEDTDTPGTDPIEAPEDGGGTDTDEIDGEGGGDTEDPEGEEGLPPVVRTPPWTEPGDVVMYVTSWCPYCDKARKFFRDRGIGFVEKDIERDAKARRELKAKTGGTGVPVIVVDGDRVIRGYNEKLLKRLFPS